MLYEFTFYFGDYLLFQCKDLIFATYFHHFRGAAGVHCFYPSVNCLPLTYRRYFLIFLRSRLRYKIRLVLLIYLMKRIQRLVS
jgi:hypothetical protein